MVSSLRIAPNTNLQSIIYNAYFIFGNVFKIFCLISMNSRRFKKVLFLLIPYKHLNIGTFREDFLNINYNGHNYILELYNILVQLLFATSKRELDV